MNTFYDLVYAGEDVETIIKARYPTARIKDASDYIHTVRFELEVDGITDEDFYPFAIREGFARCCLGFEIRLLNLDFPEGKDGPKHADTKQKIERWCKLVKEMDNR